MRLWCLRLMGTPECSFAALALAPDADAAATTVLAHVANWDDSVDEVLSVEEVIDPMPILDLDMPEPDVESAVEPAAEGPSLWRVRWNDGLFHHSAGASLVVAESAIDALRMVLEADPFEGQPPYGVPAAFGPVERFAPIIPYVIRVQIDEPSG